MTARPGDLTPSLPWSEESEQALLGVLLNDSDSARQQFDAGP